MWGQVPLHHHQCSFCGGPVECRMLGECFFQHRLICGECVEKYVKRAQ